MNDIFQAFKSSEKSYPHWSEDSNAWLGKGYYFWDSTINMAHWWGKLRFNGDYSICKSSFDCNGGDFFDLVGNSEHRKLYRVVKSKLEARLMRLLPNKIVCVNDVVNVLKKDSEIGFCSKYKAIRINPQQSKTDIEKSFFDSNNNAFFEDDPPIQLCVLDYSFFKSQPEIVY